jgi:plasmid stabilization system protein ParE
MSRPVILLPEAQDELDAAMRWYEDRRAGLGLEFLGVFDRALAQIAESAEVWSPGSRYRRLILDRFPFVVVFEIRAEGIEVTAVAHARRNPGYWRTR